LIPFVRMERSPLGQKLYSLIRAQLFSLKSVTAAQVPRLWPSPLASTMRQLMSLASAMRQLMSPVTTSPSTIVLLGIPLLDCDLVHLVSVTGQLCNPQQLSTRSWTRDFGYDTTIESFERGSPERDITPMRHELNPHIKNLHTLHPKILN